MIRDASITDSEAVTAMAMEFWRHSPFGVPADQESISNLVNHCIEKHILGVLVLDDEIVGFIAAVITPVIGNNDYKMASEMAWWVNPEHRQGRNGIALMNWLENKSRELNLHFCSMAYMHTSMPDQMASIYERKGYALSEQAFLKRVS